MFNSDCVGLGTSSGNGRTDALPRGFRGWENATWSWPRARRWHFILVCTEDSRRAVRHFQHSAFSQSSSVLFGSLFRAFREVMKFCQGCLLQSPSGIQETKYLMHFKHVHADAHRRRKPIYPAGAFTSLDVIQVRESQAISCFDIQMLLLVTGHPPVLLEHQPPSQHVSSHRPRCLLFTAEVSG